MSSFVKVLQNTNFRNLWFSQIISQIAVNMFGFILMLRTYQQTSSNVAVSGIFIALGIPAVLFGVIAGGIVDRYDKKNVLIICNALRVLVLGVFYFMSSSLAAVYIIAFLFSLITQFFIPAEAPSIPRLVKEEELLSANSLFTFSFYASTITGFILSGPSLRLFGTANVFLFVCALMILATLFVLRIPKEKKRNSNQSFSLSDIQHDISEGLRFIKNNSRISQSLYLMTFSQALIAVLSTLAPGFADKTLKIVLEDSSYLVMGPAAIGLIVGSLAVGVWGAKILKRFIIMSGVLAAAATLLLLSFLVRISHQGVVAFSFLQIPIGGLEVAMILLFILGMTNAFISVPASTVLSEDTKGPMRGRIYGVMTALTGGVAILPVLFSGILADNIGVGRTIFALGIGVLLFGLYRVLNWNEAFSTMKR